ncbi:MAG: DMT family transporter [Tepidisphaeraceae bacterium]
MLLIATAVWGLSFALAKNLGNTFNSAGGLPAQHAFGQLALTFVRFAIASIMWFAVLKWARTNWTFDLARRGAVIGVLLAVGVMLQHAGLAHVSEATTAFLTSLSILFVAGVMWVFFHKRPTPALALAITMAIPGVWLMNGGVVARAWEPGSLLVLGSSFVFAWHLISINALGTNRNPWKLAGAQFVCVAIGAGIATGVAWPAQFDWSVLAKLGVWTQFALLIAGPTFFSFGVMTSYQPAVSPTRAALIYLLEPVFAAIFAWGINGAPITLWMLSGGVLILTANAMVELWPKHAVRPGDGAA